MHAEDTDLDGVKIIHLDLFGDERGGFAETYDRNAFAKLGIDVPFVQDSWSHSADAGVVRGHHFQIPPRAQHKLVRVVRGRVFDVVVDLRHGSASFGQHVAVELDARDMTSLYVPIGFAHGFCTLEPDTEVTYKMSDHYDPACYTGVLWNDPELGIEWPVVAGDAIVSKKDAAQPPLRDMVDAFRVQESE